MPDLTFSICAAEVAPFAAVPLLLFKLQIANAPAGEEIASVTLQCQIQIEATRRRYAPAEHDGLQDLFGAPQRWAQTLRTMLWTHATVIVPAFSDTCIIDLPVPCSFDFNIAATKYCHALQDGEIPLMLQFSGTVFYRNADDALQAAPVPWHKEAAFRLPVAVWQDMMARYYPNGAWLCLQCEVFDRLGRYKAQQGLATWERALDALLDGAEEKAS